MIHDGVRPFVSKEIIEKNLLLAKQHGAVNTCIPSSDTLVCAPTGKQIENIPRRSDYWRGQTPQTFSYPLILQAHLQAKESNASDDCSLVKALDVPIHIVEGSEENIKITTEIDLSLAEQLLRLQKKVVKNREGSVQGKRIAITGGTGDIGRAISFLLEKEGGIPLPISKSASALPCDLTKGSESQKLFQTLGPIDALINCIGALKIDSFHTFSQEEIEELIRVNFLAPLYSCRYAQIAQGGHLINIASSAYFRGRKGFSLYGSAKAALVNFTQSLAEEREDIKVNILVPFRTKSAMRRRDFPEEDLSELLDPMDVARAALDLLKEESLTGGIIEVRKRFA
jgi:2-C-methyl-D-erythritol 4-phosphate cytidylyltransferase